MKIFFYVLGVLAFAVIVIIIFLMWKNKQSAMDAANQAANAATGGTGSGGGIPTGTTVPLGGAGSGTTTVLLTELAQKLCKNMPFVSNPLILDGTIPLVIARNDRPTTAMLNEGTYMVWDKSAPSGLVGGYLDYDHLSTYDTAGHKTGRCISIDPETIFQGVKMKNLIWQCTLEPPVADRENIAPSSSPYPTLGAPIATLWCYFYYEEGTEKVFPIASPFRRWFATDRMQWEYVKKAETQIAINTYSSSHPTV